MSDQPNHAEPVRAQSVEVVGNDATSMHLLMDASDTAGALSTLEVRLNRGADGAAPHFHTRSSELFYLLEGELQVMAGDQITSLAAGDSLVVPRLMPQRRTSTTTTSSTHPRGGKSGRGFAGHRRRSDKPTARHPGTRAGLP